jgi:hypothetical protein
MKSKAQLLKVVLLLVECAICLALVLVGCGEDIGAMSRSLLGFDVTHLARAFASPTPGPSPTPSPIPYVRPLHSPSLFMSDEAWQKELDRRVQAAVPIWPDAHVEGEIENPLFKRAFPQAHMYLIAVWVPEMNRSVHMTLVAMGDRFYNMPDQFNQLMFDAGYKLTDQNLDLLASALAFAALPGEIAMQPVTCDPGRKIDETENPSSDTFIHYVYEMNCHFIGGGSSFGVKFREFRDDQFSCVEGTVEHGGYVFACCPNRVSKEK